MPVASKKGGNVTINLPSLHAGQQTVLSQKRRFNIAICGRRWRKSTLAMRLTVLGAFDNKPYMWTAPTYDQVRIGWEETQKAVGHIVQFNQSVMSAIYPNSAKTIYRSAENPDNLRGHTAFGIIADEAPFIDSDAYYKVMRPFVMDTGGPIWLIGTPNGLNWVYDEFMQGLERINDPDSPTMVWQAPTLGVEIVDGKLVRKPHPLENPHILFSEILDLFHTMPERVFRQEILAEFLSDGGSVFNRVRESTMRGCRQNENYDKGRSYQMGVDLGKINDFTVISVVQTNPLRQVYWDRFNQVDWEIQIPRIERVAKQFGARVVIDSAGAGDPVYEQLLRRGVSVHPFKWSNRSKQQLIDNLAVLIEQAQHPWIMDIPIQTSELVQYQYEKTDSGVVTMNAPRGKHDDAVISLAMACMNQKWPLVVTDETHIQRPITIGEPSPFAAVAPGLW